MQEEKANTYLDYVLILTYLEYIKISCSAQNEESCDINLPPGGWRKRCCHVGTQSWSLFQQELDQFGRWDIMNSLHPHYHDNFGQELIVTR